MRFATLLVLLIDRISYQNALHMKTHAAIDALHHKRLQAMYEVSLLHCFRYPLFIRRIGSTSRGLDCCCSCSFCLYLPAILLVVIFLYALLAGKNLLITPNFNSFVIAIHSFFMKVDYSSVLLVDCQYHDHTGRRRWSSRKMQFNDRDRDGKSKKKIDNRKFKNDYEVAPDSG